MKSFEKREVYRFGLSVRLSVRPSVCTMGFWVLGLSDGAEIVQACSDGVSSCIRKVFGSRGFWVLVWRALDWEIVLYLYEIEGPLLFAQKVLEKDSGCRSGHGRLPRFLYLY